jgi:hypothetical protein
MINPEGLSYKLWAFVILLTYDGLVKSLYGPGSVIPAKAGIQCFQLIKNSLKSVMNC